MSSALIFLLFVFLGFITTISVLTYCRVRDSVGFTVDLTEVSENGEG